MKKVFPLYPYRCPRHGRIILTEAAPRCPINGCDRPLNHAGQRSFAKPIARLLRRWKDQLHRDRAAAWGQARTQEAREMAKETA